MTSPQVDAVRAYADEWSQQLFAEFRGIGTDRSGGVTRIFQGMLALGFTQTFLLATALAHQEPSWGEQDWVDELMAAERSSLLQIPGYGAVPLSRAQMARPRLTVQHAIGRLLELEARATAS